MSEQTYELAVSIPHERLEEFADFVESIGLVRPEISQRCVNAPGWNTSFAAKGLTLDQYLLAKLAWGGDA